MSNIYDMEGKKKVIFTEEPDVNITYKEIMQIVVEHATEERCHQIFCYGGINMCPSDVFGSEKMQLRRNRMHKMLVKCYSEIKKGK